MNVGFFICGCMCLLFFVIALIFAVRKEKAAILISGFNGLSAAQRERYDTAAMSKDHRNLFFKWGLLFLGGALLSLFLSPYFAAGVFLYWLVLFFGEVHIDEEKAFGKYKKQTGENHD